MSRFDNEFVSLDPENKRIAPVTYQHVYHFVKKKMKKDVAFIGLRVDDFNTSSFYASGHYKPISKIIDLNVFPKKESNEQ